MTDEIDTELRRAAKLLPAWFVQRMMTDDWSFAFIMVNGDIVHFTRINHVHLGADGIWLDVSLCDAIPWQGLKKFSGRQITAPTKRTDASINARHIMMAFETADT